jgi:hypothetical protein
MSLNSLNTPKQNKKNEQPKSLSKRLMNLAGSVVAATTLNTLAPQMPTYSQEVNQIKSEPMQIASSAIEGGSNGINLTNIPLELAVENPNSFHITNPKWAKDQNIVVNNKSHVYLVNPFNGEYILDGYNVEDYQKVSDFDLSDANQKSMRENHKWLTNALDDNKNYNIMNITPTNIKIMANPKSVDVSNITWGMTNLGQLDHLPNNFDGNFDGSVLSKIWFKHDRVFIPKGQKMDPRIKSISNVSLHVWSVNELPPASVKVNNSHVIIFSNEGLDTPNGYLKVLGRWNDTKNTIQINSANMKNKEAMMKNMAELYTEGLNRQLGISTPANVPAAEKPQTVSELESHGFKMFDPQNREKWEIDVIIGTEQEILLQRYMAQPEIDMIGQDMSAIAFSNANIEANNNRMNPNDKILFLANTPGAKVKLSVDYTSAKTGKPVHKVIADNKPADRTVLTYNKDKKPEMKKVKFTFQIIKDGKVINTISKSVEYLQ